MKVAERQTGPYHETVTWVAWPVYWSAVWVGALTALATAVVFGLIAVAIGASQVGQAAQIARWSQVSIGTLAWSVLSAFLAFVVGGWVTGKVAGIRHAEPAALHGAITWALALPLLIGLLAVGGASAFGSWYGAMVGAPVWANPSAVTANPHAAAIAQHGALAALTAVLLGLIGGVIGGWLATSEPMSFGYDRTKGSGLHRLS